MNPLIDGGGQESTRSGTLPAVVLYRFGEAKELLKEN